MRTTLLERRSDVLAENNRHAAAIKNANVIFCLSALRHQANYLPLCANERPVPDDALNAPEQFIYDRATAIVDRVLGIETFRNALAARHVHACS